MAGARAGAEAPYARSYDHLHVDIDPPTLPPAERPHVKATQHLRPDTFATGSDEDLRSG